MINNYSLLFVRKSDGLIIRLPVNPEKLPVARDTENDDYNVLGIGPITVPRIPGLKKVTISSYFPGRADLMTLTTGAFKDASFYIDFFDKSMAEKELLTYTPVRVYENGEHFMIEDNGFDVLVTGFQYEERGGETGDFYYELELTEYKDYSPLTVSVTGETDSETGAAVVATVPTRSIPKGQLYVGAKVILNGNYYYSSYGDEPHGSGNGRICVVSRISEDNERQYQVHLRTENGSALGWAAKDDLQVVEDS